MAPRFTHLFSGPCRRTSLDARTFRVMQEMGILSKAPLFWVLVFKQLFKETTPARIDPARIAGFPHFLSLPSAVTLILLQGENHSVRAEVDLTRSDAFAAFLSAAQTRGRKNMTLSRRFVVETIGTFCLVFAGCGSAVLSAAFPQTGIGWLGVSFAFGLSLLTMAYAIGHISGCHVNPAVSVGLAVARRFPAREVPAYICAQLIGGTLAAWILYAIANGKAGFDLTAGLASNGYALHSPGGYSLASCALAEIVLTCMFVLIILGATDRRVPQGFAPIAIGLGLTLVNLVGIPVTNLSVNPARSTGPALVAGGWALEQLWLFWLAPIFGAIVAGCLYPVVAGEAVVEPALYPRRAA